MKQKKRVLVTGGAGFIGSHLLQSFYNKGIYSIVVDNLSNSKHPKLKEIPKDSAERFSTFYELDIRDQEKLEGILHKYSKIDACIHLAAKVSVIDSLKNPQETFDVNVNGTRTILDVCIKFGIKNFVFASSSAVYGNAQRLPLSETENPQPISPYGESKLQAEQLVSMYSKGIIPNAVSLRFFNIYGYGQSPEYAGVITNFARRLQDGFSPIIYGNGQQTRDFISVQDIVRAIILGAGIEIRHAGDSRKQSVLNSSKSNIFNIGTGIPTKIADLANIMKEIFRSREHGNVPPVLKPMHAPLVKGDILKNYADTTKAQQILGFKYRNELRAGLEKLYSQFSFNSK